MKKILMPLLAAAVFTACNNQPAATGNTSQMETELLNTDQAFSTLVGDKGFQKAMESYYADDITVLFNGNHPLVGLEAVKKNHEEHQDTAVSLSWEVEKAKVAQSGDLGYTWGKWRNKFKTDAGVDTVVYGAYTTVWEKKNGSWKVVLDMGNQTPKPE